MLCLCVFELYSRWVPLLNAEVITIVHRALLITVETRIQETAANLSV